MEQTISPQAMQVLAVLKQQKTAVDTAQLGLLCAMEGPGLAAALEELRSAGHAMENRKGKWALPALLGCVYGRVQGTRKGYAFLLPSDGTDDIFLPQDALGSAMHDDMALVRVIARKGRARGTNRAREGEVVQVLHRARTRVVGTLERGAHASFVVPEDRRIADVFIPRDAVGDGQSGQLVVVEITAFAKPGRNAQGRVIEVLGQTGSSEADRMAIIRHYGLKDAFDPAALQEAERRAVPVQKKDLRGRTDFREQTIVTIDGADAKDFDDAIALEETPEGGYTLCVHIADVTHYVLPDTALDAEAYARGTSVYFPGAVLPMLPEALSNQMCSLQAGEDRLTLSCVMELDKGGRVQHYAFTRGVIRVTRRVTYEDANRILEQHDTALAAAYGEVTPLLERMQTLARILMRNRFGRGALDFDFPEPEFVLDEKGRAVDIFPRHRGIANQMIEEFMLAANECAARFAVERDLPFLFRVHEEPDAGRMDEYFAMLKALGVPAQKPKRKVKPRDLQAILKQAEGQPYETAVNRVLLRSLKKARYCADNLGHFGLAAKYYCHFTSPIRRYPDIIVHRGIIAALKGGLREKQLEAEHARMPEMGRHTSECERVAMEAERAVDDLKKTEYMQDKVGEEFDGMISGVTDFGLFVELPNTVEGMIRLSSLEDDFYVYDEKLFRIVGRNSGTTYALGDKVHIRVIGTDMGLRRTEFMLLQPERDPSKDNRSGGRPHRRRNHTKHRRRKNG